MNLFRCWALARVCFRTFTVSAIVCFAFLTARGDTVKTLDGQFYRGKAVLTQGALKVAETNGGEVRVSLTNLNSVVFAEVAEVIAGEQSLNAPWGSQDIGNVGAAGGARQDTNAFIVRGSGIGLSQASDGFHFVFQPMAGDAEIVARVAAIESAWPAAQAGLMIRETLGPESPHAAVVLTQGGPSSFHYRGSRRKPNPELRGPRAAVPAWLKLEKKDKFYVGSISPDGVTWKVVGSQNIGLARTRNREDQWFIGLALSSHTNAGLGSAVFDSVKVRSYGVKADFFRDEFKTLSSSEIISKPEPSWLGEPPKAIRWTGLIVPKYSETYTFSVDPKDSSQFWIDGRLLFSSSLNLMLPMFLTKQIPIEFKLESKLPEGKPSPVRLYWTSRSQGREVVPWTAFRPFRQSDPTNNSGLDPHTIDITRAQASAAGVVLKSGTLLAGVAKELDETILKFQPVGKKEEPLSALNVARVQFRSMSPQLVARIASAVPGVLLANGDFIEGECRKLSNGRVTISSVIFGLRSFDTPSEAVAVVLRPFQSAAKFVVRTNTGSALCAEEVELQEAMLTLNEPILGTLRLKSAELLDCRRIQ